MNPQNLARVEKEFGRSLNAHEISIRDIQSRLTRQQDYHIQRAFSAWRDMKNTKDRKERNFLRTMMARRLLVAADMKYRAETPIDQR